MPPPKKRNVTLKELDSLQRLFEEVSDTSQNEYNLSEDENSADEQENIQQGTSSNSSIHDPFSDSNGEFGSDSNYDPTRDELGQSDDDSYSSQAGKSRRNIATSSATMPANTYTVVIEPCRSSSPNGNEESVAQMSVSATPSSLRGQELLYKPPHSDEQPGPSGQHPTNQLSCSTQSTNTTAIPTEEPVLISQSVIHSEGGSPVNSSNILVGSPSILGQRTSTDSPVGINIEPTDDHQPLSITGNTTQNQRESPPENNRQQTSSPNNIESDWEDTTAPILDFGFDRTNEGPTVNLNSNTMPVDILDLLFTEELLQYVVKCTNDYGARLVNMSRPHTRGSRKQYFKPTDVTEMRKFFGLCLLQGNIDSPTIRHLFTFTNPLYFHPLFPFTMSGRRFEQLLRCLCISELNSKGMDKVKVFVSKVIKNFQDILKPGEALSLDESLMGFRGRLRFRQYIKTKKAKYGIKFYIVTTHDGYILNFVIYEGKNTLNAENNKKTESKLEKLVMKLMQPYLNKGHSLYMDNYYNSVNLSRKLLQHKTHTIGTLRKDRKENPKEMLKKSLKVGEHNWKRKGNIYVSIWKDKRPVSMITTKHHPRLVVSRNRYNQTKIKPLEIVDYNKHMSGVDRSDQMLAYYSTPKKTIRWYKKVFFHVFDMMIWNAFYIYKQQCNSKATLLSFRDSIINNYLGVNDDTLEGLKSITQKHKNTNRRFASQASAAAVNVEAQSQPHIQSSTSSTHWPEQIPVGENAKRAKVFLKCRVCTKRKIVKQTSYRCGSCNEKPALCPGCFKAWHTDPMFKK